MNKFLHKSAVFAFAMTLVAASVSAKPHAPPPPTYYYDASEGGWVDTTNNLVWGLDYTYFTTATPDGTTSFNPPQAVSWQTAQSMAANYPALLAQYGWTDAAIVATYWEAQGLDWRQPTASEVTTAYDAGFLESTYTIFWDTPRWTSSFGSKKGVFVAAYWIDLNTGTVGLDVAGAPAFPLFVRPFH
jgi:hypothetical protein